MAGFAECPVLLRTSYMACHRYAVIAEVEPGGGDIEQINKALKEGSRVCVRSVAKVAAPSSIYYDAERHAVFALQA